MRAPNTALKASTLKSQPSSGMLEPATPPFPRSDPIVLLLSSWMASTGSVGESEDVSGPLPSNRNQPRLYVCSPFALWCRSGGRGFSADARERQVQTYDLYHA